MKWPFRRTKLPEGIRSQFSRDERVLAAVATEDGGVLAATRFGLWWQHDDSVERIDWHQVSRARLKGDVIFITRAALAGAWPDGTVLLRDEPEVRIVPERPGVLTDTIHHRVRASVHASTHLPWPQAGGWVVLRKVAGRDGLVVQLRLDEGADPDADGFSEAVADVVDRLWPPTVERGPDLSL